jgi:hypothetical protein
MVLNYPNLFILSFVESSNSGSKIFQKSSSLTLITGVLASSKHPGPFKLSNDSDSQFLAMCDICPRMVGVGPGGGFVTATVDGGDPDEIDKLRIGKAL